MISCRNYMQHIMKLSNKCKTPKYLNTCRRQQMECKPKKRGRPARKVADLTAEHEKKGEALSTEWLALSEDADVVLECPETLSANAKLSAPRKN